MQTVTAFEWLGRSALLGLGLGAGCLLEASLGLYPYPCLLDVLAAENKGTLPGRQAILGLRFPLG